MIRDAPQGAAVYGIAWAKTSFTWSGSARVLNSAAMAGQKAASNGTHRPDHSGSICQAQRKVE